MNPAGEQSVPIVLDGTEGTTSAVLRAALSLSAVTRRSINLEWESATGLSASGLAALNAARSLLGATGEEPKVGARAVTVEAGAPKLGRIDLGDADVCPIVEMVCLPLALSGTATELKIGGVTHGPDVESFHELAFGWFPITEQLGLTGELRLDAAGFLPDCGGLVAAKIFPSPRLHAIDLTQRGMLVEVQAIVLLSNVRMGIALPLERRLEERMRTCGIAAQTEVLPLPAEKGRGLALVILAQFEKTRVAFVSVGGAGRTAEAVADRAVDQLQDFLQRRGAVPGELAERLLIPMALASSSCGAPGAIGRDLRGTSRLATTRITETLLPIAEVARRFLDVEIQIQGLPGDEGLIEVRPAGLVP